MEQLSVQIIVATGAINSCEQPELFKSTSKLHGLKFFISNFRFCQFVFHLFKINFYKYAY